MDLLQVDVIDEPGKLSEIKVGTLSYQIWNLRLIDQPLVYEQ